MTRDMFVRWTCNACRLEAVTVPDKQPEGWVGYGFSDPDFPEGEKRLIGHLCPDCTAAVNAAWDR